MNAKGVNNLDAPGHWVEMALNVGSHVVNTLSPYR
jgi:hypothetical protein